MLAIILLSPRRKANQAGTILGKLDLTKPFKMPNPYGGGIFDLRFAICNLEMCEAIGRPTASIQLTSVSPFADTGLWLTIGA
jgi:hypothetical protein